MIRLLLRTLSADAGEPPVPVPPRVQLRRARWPAVIGGWFIRGRRSAAAVTIGDTILVRPDVPLSAALISHELEHVRQWRAAPLTFPLRYAWHYLRRGYRENPYEVAARAAEHDHRHA